MVVIKGYLQNGASKPIKDSTIVLKATKNTSAVLIKTEAFELSQDGYYEINVLPCTYEVFLHENNAMPKQLGVIEVFADSKTGTLNDFLLLPKEGQTVTPEVIEQIVEERIKAQQAATDSKDYATNAQNSSNNAASTLANAVKKTGDTMSGALLLNSEYPQLQFKTTINQHQIMANPSGDFYFYLQNSSGLAGTKLKYSSVLNRWEFTVDDVLINNSRILKVGDAALIKKSNNSDSRERYTKIATGKIQSNQYCNLSLLVAGGCGGGSGNNQIDIINLSTRGATTLRQISIESATRDVYFMKYGYVINGDDVEFWIKSPGWSITPQITTISTGNAESYLKQEAISWVYDEPESIIYVDSIQLKTNENSTVDSNGFLKSASPILRLFANDNIEVVDGFTKVGCGLINSEAKGVIAKRIRVGHYEVHGSLGFSREGWTIEQPKDENGNVYSIVEKSEDEKGVITIKTYTKKFDFETCNIVADKPADIKSGRWIDLRLEMPVVDVIEPVQSTPSLLNPVIV